MRGEEKRGKRKGEGREREGQSHGGDLFLSVFNLSFYPSAKRLDLRRGERGKKGKKGRRIWRTLMDSLESYRRTTGGENKKGEERVGLSLKANLVDSGFPPEREKIRTKRGKKKRKWEREVKADGMQRRPAFLLNLGVGKE